MNNYFVILAAGKSKRFGKNFLKQFYKYKNKEIIDHSVEKSLKSKLFKKIIIVSNNARYLKKKKYPKLVSIIKGGKERSDSSLNALKFIKKYKPKKVFIHDAARPNFSLKLKACGVCVSNEFFLFKLNTSFLILYLTESLEFTIGTTALFFFKFFEIFLSNFIEKFGLAAS